MPESEKQFQVLLSHLVTRVDQLLAAHEPIQPLGLVLRADGKVDVTVGAAASASNVQAMTVALRQSLIAAVTDDQVQASCLAFPNDASPAVIALLETRDNECATVSVPILEGAARKLDTGNMQIDDGFIYVFPVLDDA